jgi:magnesium chelatase subunit D
VPLHPGDSADIALDATIRAAAPFQRDRASQGALVIAPHDLRRRVRTRRVGSSIVFCVDASGSMGAAKRMEAAKAAILELLIDAYQRRDRVALVSFRGDAAQIVLSPTSSVELAHLRLRALPTGGATPLAHGLVRSLELLEAERRREADVQPWLVLITDGRANVGLATGLGVDDARSAARRIAESGIKTLVIDTAGSGGGAPARDIARAAGAEYLRLGDADSTALTTAIRARVQR